MRDPYRTPAPKPPPPHWTETLREMCVKSGITTQQMMEVWPHLFDVHNDFFEVAKGKKP
jgi:hypothetical protein